MWDRKRRQYLCGFVPNVKDDYECMQPPDDLRVALCHNKANKSLIEVLKTDLECGWNFSGRVYANVFMVVLLFVMIVVVGV